MSKVKAPSVEAVDDNVRHLLDALGDPPKGDGVPAYMPPERARIRPIIVDDQTTLALDPSDCIERVLVLCMCAGFFESDAQVTGQVLRLARRAPRGDVDLDKIRSFAASAGDTITHADALRVIKHIARERVRSRS